MGVDAGEGDGVLVAGFEVEIGWIEVGGVEAKIRPALSAAVDGRH